MAPWTQDEDALLEAGMRAHGQDWVEVAKFVPNRNNKACRKRFLHAKASKVKKGSWSADEDGLLLKLYNKHGPKWAEIARGITGRTDDACAKRYRDALDPNLNKAQFSASEDTKLIALVAQHGTTWSKIGKELNRGSLVCRNRYRLLDRRGHRGTSSGENSPASYTSSESSLPALSPVDDFNWFEFPLSCDIPQATAPGEFPVLFTSSWEEPSGHSPPAQQTMQGVPSMNNVGSLGVFEPSTPGGIFPSPVDGLPTLSLPEDGSQWFCHSQPASFGPTASQDLTHTTESAIPPFNYSSSSLSTALSAPLLFRPLPSGSPSSNVIPQTQHAHSQPSSYASTPVMGENYMDPPAVLPSIAQQDAIFQQGDYAPTLLMPFPMGPMPGFNEMNYLGMSPISPDLELPLNFESGWKSADFSALFFAAGEQQQCSPSMVRTSASSVSELSGTPSSTSSTPSSSTSLSPANSLSSPTPATPETPSSTLSQQSSLPMGTDNDISLLFSTPSQVQAELRSQKRAANRPKPDAVKSKAETIAYACGFPSCWGTQLHRYRTSKDLERHMRKSHSGDESCDNVYRCCLNGCDKSYKTMRGLEYHLQASQYHYRDMIHQHFLTRGSPQSPVNEVLEPDDGGDERKHKCPHLNCFKAFKTGSGLSYHLNKASDHKGTSLPMQLQQLPPTLERQLPKRMKRLRPKDPLNPFPAILAATSPS
ncbi:hypothetical protein BKA70DRAFT_335090 [Coprinopsis sp. MPI-PUGE-AT-0042]|nr:hypothetical protein BKA70DRAFT_335090 [Coprinopsis sp. MPI-PUGE-AT-0042]